MGRCRCQSGKTYRRCCQRWHEGTPAPTPEALMRSRYAAYALRLVDYIIATTDPDGPEAKSDTTAWRTEIEAFCRRTRFEGLKIEATGDDWVQFYAQLRSQDRDTSFRERSRFTQSDGRWRYHSAMPSESSPER